MPILAAAAIIAVIAYLFPFPLDFSGSPPPPPPPAPPVVVTVVQPPPDTGGMTVLLVCVLFAVAIVATAVVTAWLLGRSRRRLADSVALHAGTCAHSAVPNGAYGALSNEHGGVTPYHGPAANWEHRGRDGELG